MSRFMSNSKFKISVVNQWLISFSYYILILLSLSKKQSGPHLIDGTFQAIEGMRVSLGATRVLQYILQGLFHPKREVRAVYWRLYNNLYIGSQDALGPSYPKLDDDDDHCYRRTELELILQKRFIKYFYIQVERM